MIIVIANPTVIENEAAIINQLFDAGLAIFHLRKPYYSLKETEKLLLKIDKQYHSRIALHQQHQLSNSFAIKRLHYTEADRQNKMNVIKQKNDFIQSTAIHQLKNYENITDAFDYCFLSPVLDSISKPDLKSIITSGFKLPPIKKTKIIALGGIDIHHISTVKEYGFNGIAVLGSIWKESKNAVVHFKQLQKKWEN